MSVISIYVDPNANGTDVISAVRPVTGASISTIQRAVRDRSPVFERELFLNDFAHVADALRTLVGSLEGNGIAHEIREFDDPIEREVLMNILDGSEDYA